MQEIRLNEYRAQIDDLQLCLGTWDSYGIETLKVIPGTGWEELTITATFVTPEGSTRVLVPQDGVLPVPQEATAHPSPIGTKGQIVFAGVADGVQRISTSVLYIVTDHAPVEGKGSHPTPSEFAQFVAQVKDDADRADAAAAKIPVPTPADAGKNLVAQEDGTYGLVLLGGGGESGTSYRIGYGLKLTAGDILEVDAANAVEQDNTLPVTSAAVYTQVGNIDALLQTI